MKNQRRGLPAISTEIAQIKCEQELFRVTGLLIALLRHKHEGRAFIPAQLAQDSQHLGVHHQFIPELRTLRITVVGRDGQPIKEVLDKSDLELSGAENPVNTEFDSESQPEPPPEPLNCSGDWHKQTDALGLRCPLCGRSDKVL